GTRSPTFVAVAHSFGCQASVVDRIRVPGRRRPMLWTDRPANVTAVVPGTGCGQNETGFDAVDGSTRKRHTCGARHWLWTNGRLTGQLGHARVRAARPG